MALLFAPNPICRAAKLPSPHFAPSCVSIIQPRPTWPRRLLLHPRRLHATATGEELAVVDEPTSTVTDSSGEEEVNLRKLYVANLPWSLTAAEIEKLFAECGTVSNIDVVKQRNGKSRGYAFVTMSTDEEAQAAVEKFNSYELMERTIKVELAKNYNKPSPPPPVTTTVVETNKLYISNLAWKARATHIREFFADFKPVSARVVFETNAGKSAGYGFVGFATQEDTAAALAELDGKEIMGRAIRLRISERVEKDAERVEKNVEGAQTDDNVDVESEETNNTEEQTDTS